MEVSGTCSPTKACGGVGRAGSLRPRSPQSQLYQDGSLGTCGSSHWTCGALSSFSKGQSEGCDCKNLVCIAWAMGSCSRPAPPSQRC